MWGRPEFSPHTSQLSAGLKLSALQLFLCRRTMQKIKPGPLKVICCRRVFKEEGKKVCLLLRMLFVGFKIAFGSFDNHNCTLVYITSKRELKLLHLCCSCSLLIHTGNPAVPLAVFYPLKRQECCILSQQLL